MSVRSKISLLLLLLSICGSAVLAVHFRKESARQATPAQLYAIVSEQMDAMRQAEFSRAYQRASFNVQQRLNIEQFIETVRAEYADALDCDKMEYGAVQITGERAALQVYFIERTGHVLPCVFFLVFEEGRWKVDGAKLMHRWPLNERLGGLRA